MTNDENSNKTAQGVAASLQKSIAESLDRQRSLWQEVSRITTSESTQFTKRRLEKTASALQNLKVDSSDPYSAVVSQQQWLHELVQDYTDQSLRYKKSYEIWQWKLSASNWLRAERRLMRAEKWFVPKLRRQSRLSKHK
jgi:hypothetical protein